MSNEYILENGELTNERGVRKAFPNTSINFKQLGTMATLVMPTPKPTCGELERVVRDGTTTDGLGNLVMNWKIVDMFNDRVEEDVTITKAEQETEYLANKLQKAKDAKCDLVDKATSASILEMASENKQRNYLAKYNELLEKKLDGVITEDETQNMTELKELWTSIETLVNNGNTKEAEIQACETVAELEAIGE